jgi:DNA-binding NarL/FixJ family response regulator
MKAHSDTEKKARLLVADDHAPMRIGIKAILAKDVTLEVVGEAEDGEQAIARCRELRPELILMDVSMPKLDGIEATRAIKDQFPETSVLMLTAFDDQGLLLKAVKAGAAGYVLKGSDPGHLLGSVRAVLEGDTPLDSRLAMRLLRQLSTEQPTSPEKRRQRAAEEGLPRGAPAASLSPRELEVLRKVVEGKTNRLIAQELHMSLSTMKRHLERVVSKLGVSDRTQAAVKAIEFGLLSQQPESEEHSLYKNL